jgi:hypothetical protein
MGMTRMDHEQTASAVADHGRPASFAADRAIGLATLAADSPEHQATRDVSARTSTALSVSVAIPAYTMKRWALLVKAVESARSQTVPVARVVVCIDNNEELLDRATAEWAHATGTPVTVIANRHSDHLTRVSVHQAAHGTTRRFGAGSARNNRL